MSEIIEVNQLSKKFKIKKNTSTIKNIFKPEYKTITAVDKISFNIKKGEFVATTGLSGCGKSTMQKLLLGLYRPDKGELYLKKKDGSEEVCLW